MTMSGEGNGIPMVGLGISTHLGNHSSTNLQLQKSLEGGPAEYEVDVASVADSSAFSFRTFGIGFLVLAIIVAILLASVPSSLNTNNQLNVVQTGYLYFTLLGVFLLLLLSCLFCTYYLGGARDNWEDPSFTVIRINFTNITAIAGLFIEFIQVCGFSFHADAQFTGSGHFINMLYLAVPYRTADVFNVVYWVMFVMAFSPYIFVVSVRLIIYTINHRKGDTEAAQFVKTYQQKIYSVLWFLVNTIYVPVISTMFGGIDCTFEDSGSDGYPIFDVDSSTHCLSQKQLAFLACSLLALVIYYPAASFAQAQTQNISDIKFKPRVVFIFVQGKVILAAIYVFFSNHHEVVYLVIILLTDFAMLGLNIYMKPCLVQWVNQMRTVFFGVSTWTTICSLISTNVSVNPNTPLILLIIGWVVGFVGMPIFFIVWHRLTHQQNDGKATEHA